MGGRARAVPEGRSRSHVAGNAVAVPVPEGHAGSAVLLSTA